MTSTTRQRIIDQLRGYARAKAMDESLKGTHKEHGAGELVKKRLDRVTSMVESVSDDIGANVLLLRFVNLMDWQDISDKMGLSPSTVYRHYITALDELEANEQE